MYFSNMLFSRFFKQPKPNKFGYTAVYYDEKKEERDLRFRQISREIGIDKEGIKFDKEGFRERFSSQVKSSRNTETKHGFSLKGQGKKSNIRLLAIILIIALVLYIQFG
jgi:hypothetical protein